MNNTNIKVVKEDVLMLPEYRPDFCMYKWIKYRILAINVVELLYCIDIEADIQDWVRIENCDLPNRWKDLPYNY